MGEAEKKSTWGLLLKKAGGLYETSKTVAKNVKTAAQEWKEAKVDVMPTQLSSLQRDPVEYRRVAEFKEVEPVGEFEACPPSESISAHEVRGVVWAMCRIQQTIQKGGYLTPTLYIPKDVWYQDVVKISSFQLKLASCQELLLKMKDLRTTASSCGNDVAGVCKALVSLTEAIEGVQAGMAFQVSGVEEEQETGGKEGLDKLKTLSYSFAKTASRIAHSAVDVTKLTPEQNKGYLSTLTSLFEESQYIETLLSLGTQKSSPFSSSLPISSASVHPATNSDPLENQQPSTYHPASLSESSGTLTIHTSSVTEGETTELMKLLLNVTKLLSRTILRFVVDDLMSRLKLYNAAQTHLFVDAFE